MIVVSDATAINHLAQAGLLHLLARMLGTVVVPVAVFNELQADQTPSIVREIVGSKPEWLHVMQASIVVDAELDELDQGEREAIILTEELHADFLLMDEKKGRGIALQRGINLIGTLGLLEKAALGGLVDFRDALESLKATGFYLSRDLEMNFLTRFPEGEKDNA